jgi:hypothetical protein
LVVLVAQPASIAMLRPIRLAAIAVDFMRVLLAWLLFQHRALGGMCLAFEGYCTCRLSEGLMCASIATSVDTDMGLVSAHGTQQAGAE